MFSLSFPGSCKSGFGARYASLRQSFRFLHEMGQPLPAFVVRRDQTIALHRVCSHAELRNRYTTAFGSKRQVFATRRRATLRWNHLHNVELIQQLVPYGSSLVAVGNTSRMAFCWAPPFRCHGIRCMRLLFRFAPRSGVHNFIHQAHGQKPRAYGLRVSTNWVLSPSVLVIASD
jgi:hypothetical protein